AIIPTGIVLFISQLRAEHQSVSDALVSATGGVVAIVPEGLILLTNVAFAVGVVRLARRRTLVQELPAIEILARVDVVCLDKTGTITHGDIVFDELRVLDASREADVHEALALSAHGADANATATALAVRFANTSWQRVGGIPFSSARKWSAVSAAGNG